MKVFLSWSGPASKNVALALRDWLPNVIQALEPWMSSEDIEKGARWSAEVAAELANTKAGIVCVTPDNRDAPWLHFEAGALSKTVEKELVCPYLFWLKPSDLKGPLVQFQASDTTEAETRKMIETLNRATEKPLPESKLSEAFGIWWGKLEVKLRSISLAGPLHSSRPAEDMLEEILSIVRDQSRESQERMVALQKLNTEVAARQARDELMRSQELFRKQLDKLFGNSGSTDSAKTNNRTLLTEDTSATPAPENPSNQK